MGGCVCKERCCDPTPALSRGGELLAKLKMPRAGTASRCDCFLSEVVYFETDHVLHLPNPGHQFERRSLGGRGSLPTWKEPCVAAQCKRECLQCMSWLCCLGVADGCETWQAAISCRAWLCFHTPWWLPCLVSHLCGHRSCCLALLLCCRCSQCRVGLGPLGKNWC